MTRHTIQAALTRFVLIVCLAVSIGVGSVSLEGGVAAAMPKDCDRLLHISSYYLSLAYYLSDQGHYQFAAQAYQTSWNYLNQYIAC